MVRVVSCRYMRISCTEDDHPLFRRYYARSNRERGVKLLRCFPHCCPEHVERCYCGSSIHVMVTFAAELPASVQGSLVVCARFEPSRVVPLWPPNLAGAPGYAVTDDTNERKLRPGEIVPLPESLLTSGNRKAKHAVWIRADREGESKQTTKNAILYVLNNHRFPKWLYSYDSSATWTQREMTHHLVVYVCQLTGTRARPGEAHATVLARHESPGFSLISYRRSGNNARDAGCDLPALEVDSDTKFAAVEVDPSPQQLSPPSDDMDIDSMNWSSPWRDHDTRETKPVCSQQQPHIIQPHDSIYQSYRQAGRAVGFRTSITGEESDLWQHGPYARSCAFQDKGQHLLILWLFLRNVSLSDLGFGTNTDNERIRSYWLSVAAAFQASPSVRQRFETVVDSFLKNELGDASSIQHDTKTRPSAVIRVVASLFVRALSSCSIQRLLRSACSIQIDATNSVQLQETFVSLVSEFYDALCEVLLEISATMAETLPGVQTFSLANLLDEILSLVYSQTRFSELRAEIMDYLMKRDAAGSLSVALNSACRMFIILVQETNITTSESIVRPSSRPRSGDDNLMWNQRWLLEPGSVQLTGIASGAAQNIICDLHVVDVAQFMFEFGCVDVAVDDDGSKISLRSAHLEAVASPMTLILDGRLRKFQVLPSGLPSMIATARGWSLGDYTARLSDDGSSLNVNFFTFAEAAFAHGFASLNRESVIEEMWMRQVSLSIRLEEEVVDRNADSSADTEDLFAFVQGTVYGSTFLPGFKLSEASAVDRAAIWRVAEWTALWELQAGYIALPRVGFV